MKLFNIIKSMFGLSFGTGWNYRSVQALNGQDLCGGSSIYNKQRCFVSNNNAAYIIRRLVVDPSNGESQWFDLETADHTNSAVAVAIRYCWYYAALYPDSSQRYCSDRAARYFIKIADMLEDGDFDDTALEACDDQLSRDDLPPQLKVL